MSDVNIPDNNMGKFRIPGEEPATVAEEPILSSEAFEYFKKLRIELNEILIQNRAAFKELVVLAPESSAKHPEVLALLMLLAKRLYNADSETTFETKK